MMDYRRFRRVFARGFLSSVIVGAALAATGGVASAAGLFDNPTQADMRAAAQADADQPGDFRDRLVRRTGSPGAIRDRVVRLNTTELAKIVPSGLDNAAGRLERARGLSNSVRLDLFPDVSVTAERTDVDAPETGGYVWAGEQSGARHAYVTLVINDGEITGHVQAGAKLFSIEPVSGDVHRIIEIDRGRMLEDIHMPVPTDALKQKSNAEEPDSKADPKAKTTVRVLVGNTINARNECRRGSVAKKRACIQARINLAVSLTNQAFNRSGVLIRFVRVGGESEVNYDEAALYDGLNGSTNYTFMLCDLSNLLCGGNNQFGKFAGLRNKRERFNADLVAVVRKAGAACGIAWVPRAPEASTQGYGFSVTTSTKGGVYNCIEGQTFAHETGHNFGLNHDREQDRIETGGPTPPRNEYNYGHVDDVGDFFTIMSYRSSCNAGFGCRRLPNFSNPNKDDPQSRRPTGKPQGAPGIQGAADSARWLNENRASVSNYR
jgi:hypothetical protein